MFKWNKRNSSKPILVLTYQIRQPSTSFSYSFACGVLGVLSTEKFIK
jgi:hypothetical protein